MSLVSKEERMNSAIVNSLRSFLGLFNGRSGRRSNEDQNAYDAVMAALDTHDLTSAKLGWMISRTLNMSHRQIKRGRLLRKTMEDIYKKRWLRKSSAVPKNAIGEGKSIPVLYSSKWYHLLNFCIFNAPYLLTTEHLSALSEWMHSKECSRIDNNDKVPVIVDLGVCPHSGTQIYDLHERRELLYDDNEILDELTGRNRMNKNKPNPRHPVWSESFNAQQHQSGQKALQDLPN